MGVWIETKKWYQRAIGFQSHTLRGCVDWNTASINEWFILVSHTLRGCVDWNSTSSASLRSSAVTPFVGVWIETGIKKPARLGRMSHPSWVCGLKLYHQRRNNPSSRSHPSWVCGLKHNNMGNVCHLLTVTPFVGVWIETSMIDINPQVNSSHTLRGCVDWNLRLMAELAVMHVTPFVGVWIETRYATTKSANSFVTPFVGVWI